MNWWKRWIYSLAVKAAAEIEAEERRRLVEALKIPDPFVPESIGFNPLPEKLRVQNFGPFPSHPDGINVPGTRPVRVTAKGRLTFLPVLVPFCDHPKVEPRGKAKAPRCLVCGAWVEEIPVDLAAVGEGFQTGEADPFRKRWKVSGWSPAQRAGSEQARKDREDGRRKRIEQIRNRGPVSEGWEELQKAVPAIDFNEGEEVPRGTDPA